MGTNFGSSSIWVMERVTSTPQNDQLAHLASPPAGDKENEMKHLAWIMNPVNPVLAVIAYVWIWILW